MTGARRFQRLYKILEASQRFDKLQETLRLRLKKVKKAQVDSIWFKNKQEDYGSFKKIWEFQEGSSRLKKYQEGSKRLKKFQEGSRRFKKV